MLTSLARLPLAQRAVLRAVRGTGSYRRRLLELGFVPGTELRLVRRVSVGNVLEVELRHSRMSLRISEAEDIEVEPILGLETSSGPEAGEVGTGPASPGRVAR